ncbi:MAG: hypothetical protein AUI12_06265 [Acidobacteria bacterium 13_2_20CM_2_57_6]|nr:MAG: hypothetical protein AUI12_06265 [Acidobacteria bacterium 13_2_20CM_2_57_6]PYT44837.1 MAG: hypothetical protein DMG45_03350 [Acidobacteriota bacterium]
MKADPKTTSGRAFVRSLNILLKFARLYGYEHARTIEQLQIAWQELRTAIPLGTEAGLLLGATNSQLLLDGVPLEGSPAEKQFAQLLSAAGLASIQFFSSVTEEEIGRFARAFPTGKSKPAELALQLKSALAGAQGIRINEICFVATDSRLKESSIAAQLASASLGGEQEQVREWLNDPKKLLELIAAAQGSKGPGGSGAGNANAAADGSAASATGATTTTGCGLGGEADGVFLGLRGGTGPQWKGAGHAAAPTEDEVLGILGALTNFGRIGAGQAGPGGGVGPARLQQQMAEMPDQSQDLLRQALASLVAKAPNAKVDESVIVQLAEHLAIRFALERFERGEVKVNAVRQMLDRMNQEIENLRKILGAHEDKMTDAGILAESHREILDRQFWAEVPDSGKRAVLLSEEAWCIPPRNVQSYVGELIKHGEIAEAVSILQNYAACADSEEAEARKKTAAGLSEMAELYAKADPKLLGEALRHLGLRLSIEQDAELQALVNAAFVRLSQEAATSHCFPAMQQALDLIAGVETQRPGIARSLRGKMGIEERVPEFVDEALKARHVAAGLTNVLKLLPQTTMEQLSVRFNRCSLRDDSEHVANLAADLGEEGVQYLRSTVRGGPIAEAVEMAGLLSRLDPESVMVFLPGRMKDFPRTSQDRIVRQISASGAARRCHILLELLDHVDPLVTPLVIDEIGVAADREALGKLLTIADGDLPTGGGPYLRVKAVEAVGRINAPESISTLKRIAESKKVFGWLHPQELRIAALQALEKLDPEWVREFLPKSGIEKEEYTLAPLDVPVTSKFVRQRRHTRVRLKKAVRAICTNLKEGCSLEIKTASLTGGVATLSRHLTPGTQVQLRFQIGMRNFHVTALMRDSRAQDMAFEIVDMDLDERGKYRRLLAGNLSASSNNQTAAENDLVPVPAGLVGSK